MSLLKVTLRQMNFLRLHNQKNRKEDHAVSKSYTKISKGIEPGSPALQADSLPYESPGKLKLSKSDTKLHQFHGKVFRVHYLLQINTYLYIYFSLHYCSPIILE